jgi:hypothetical protein
MAKYLHHEPCPNCGSRDNLARYSDGSAYCFGCRYVEPPSLRALAPKVREDVGERDYEAHEWTKEFGPSAVEWMSKYEITVPDALKHGFLFHPRRNQLIFPWYNDTFEVIGYQARNFAEGAKRKYHTEGDIANLLPIYRNSSTNLTRHVVLVEDVISAVKISRYSDAMPCLSSGIPVKKLKRLAGLYDAFTVWLDGNMFTNATRMADQLQLMGREANVILTNKDPKEHTYAEINEILVR